MKRRMVVMVKEVQAMKFRDAKGKCVGAIMRGEDGGARLLGRYTHRHEFVLRRKP